MSSFKLLSLKDSSCLSCLARTDLKTDKLNAMVPRLNTTACIRGRCEIRLGALEGTIQAVGKRIYVASGMNFVFGECGRKRVNAQWAVTQPAAVFRVRKNFFDNLA